MNQNTNNPFGSLNTEGMEEARDVLGGGGAFESGVYTGIIKLAYAGESKGGANSLTVHVDINGREYRETLYVTSGTAKGCKNYYEKGGKKYPMPGYTTANDIALLSTGVSLNEQDFEECVVKLYDYDAKAEVPTKVLAAKSLHGKEITLGLLKQTVDKTKLNEATNEYEPTGETRDENIIDKVFHTESGRTVSEFLKNTEQAEFQSKWSDKNTGQTRDRTSGTTGKVASSNTQAANSAPGKTAAKKSLFG